jgi:hypothetical protein
MYDILHKRGTHFHLRKLAYGTFGGMQTRSYLFSMPQGYLLAEMINLFKWPKLLHFKFE